MTLTELIEWFLQGNELFPGDLMTVQQALYIMLPVVFCIGCVIGLFWLLKGVFKW